MPGQATAFAFVEKVNEIILFPIIYLLSTVALLVFLIGGFKYVANASSDQAREEGRRSMLYGLIGILVMLSAYAILTIATNTFGLTGSLEDCANNTGPCIDRQPTPLP